MDKILSVGTRSLKIANVNLCLRMRSLCKLDYITDMHDVAVLVNHDVSVVSVLNLK